MKAVFEPRCGPENQFVVKFICLHVYVCPLGVLYIGAMKAASHTHTKICLCKEENDSLLIIRDIYIY